MSNVRKISGATNGGKAAIESGLPYAVAVTIRGAADLLMHRWNPDAVDAKAKAAKNSAAKKSDDLESYVYRDQAGMIAIPGEYLRQAIVAAAKYKQDPRSPRKSAQDLFKAGVISLTGLSSLGVENWDYEDRRRVVVQRNGINRTRPAMRSGWTLDVEFMVNTPEYISPDLLREVLEIAGRLIGIGDFRPTYGRFFVAGFEVMSAVPDSVAA